MYNFKRRMSTCHIFPEHELSSFALLMHSGFKVDFYALVLRINVIFLTRIDAPFLISPYEYGIWCMHGCTCRSYSIRCVLSLIHNQVLLRGAIGLTKGFVKIFSESSIG